MPSLPAIIFGFATGIANADKIDVVTSTHAARLIKSRRRIGSSFGSRVFAAPRECFEDLTVPNNVTCRLHRRCSASDLLERSGRFAVLVPQRASVGAGRQH